MAYIHYPSFAILINGNPLNFFRSAIGIRQGCPLSSYFFICSANILSWALGEAANESDLDPYVLASGAQSRSHLLFSNDCLLLG